MKFILYLTFFPLLFFWWIIKFGLKVIFWIFGGTAMFLDGYNSAAAKRKR